MKLTDALLRKAKPTLKAYRLSDGRWPVIARDARRGQAVALPHLFNHREKMLSFGTYPDVSLQLERDRRAGLLTKLTFHIRRNFLWFHGDVRYRRGELQRKRHPLIASDVDDL